MLFQLICTVSLVHKFFSNPHWKNFEKNYDKILYWYKCGGGGGQYDIPKKRNVFLPFFSNFNPLVEVRKKMQSSSLKKSWYCFIAWLPT